MKICQFLILNLLSVVNLPFNRLSWLLWLEGYLAFVHFKKLHIPLKRLLAAIFSPVINLDSN